MVKSHNNDGFSLTETLLAVGVLAVGMIFIAGVFPVGIYFTTIATERTIAAVVADEAFAKIRLYGIDIDSTTTIACVDFNDVTFGGLGIDADEFAYPSDPNIDISRKKYFWSALCRRTSTEGRLVQVTVFVSRRTSPNLEYRTPDRSDDADWPMPVPVGISKDSDNELRIDSGYETFINDGYTIVDDETGQLYRVLERYTPPDDKMILLDRKWDGGSTGSVWVVPPPVNSGRYPCIAIYQKVMRF